MKDENGWHSILLMRKVTANEMNADTTLQYYQQNAESFVKETVSADMHDARTRFLHMLREHACILDFGCGSGRDTKVFLEKGYRVDAVDGSDEMCRIASVITGIPVKRMLFEELSVASKYDGVWACASILHLQRTELADVLQKISDSLKIGGVLYSSFKYGDFEGNRDGRYFTDFTEDSMKCLMARVASLQVADTWITNDVRPGREEERWINILARRS